MTTSVSVSRWGGPPPAPPAEGDGQAQQVRYGIDPQVLMASGILRNPAIPEQALERAKSLCAQSRYSEARAALVPHLNNADSAVEAELRGVLAECALRGVGSEPRAAIEEALASHRLSGDDRRVALMLTLSAELDLQTGEFRHARKSLKEAYAIFRERKERAPASRVSTLMAEVELLSGDTNRALDFARQAAKEAGEGTESTSAVRLVLARIHAHRNAPNEVARDLVEAERLSRSRVSLAERLRPRIARAETLLTLGFDKRALRGLRRVLIDVVTLEDTQVRAKVHLLLGLSSVASDATFARRHLKRARHLYEGFEATYGMTRADLGLLRVEHRLGLNTRPRLESLESVDLDRWPLLRAQLAIARVEIFSGSRPAVCRRAVLRER
ncbi:MAG: hypothetical protein AAF658_17130, partial [Myxococcota bacterium]